MSDTVRFKDFSLEDVNITIRIAPDDFTCYPEIPLDAMMEIAQFARDKDKSDNTMDRFKQLLGLLEAVMYPDDYDRFIARTKAGTRENPNPHPIGLRHVMNMLPWIMEVYGLRPTQESSTSADGSESTNTSSTEGASVTVSTS